MTEILDPCEEVTEPEREDGPSVLPLTTEAEPPIDAAFPIRDFQEIEPLAIRESSLINQQNLNFNLPNNKGVIRYPVDVLAMNDTGKRYFIDPFRYSAGKFFLFENSRLSFFNKGVNPSPSASTFYEIRANSRMLGSTEKNEISLIVDNNALTKLRDGDSRYPTANEKFIEAYFLGSRGGRATEDWPQIAQPKVTYIDNAFTCPAAFFENEASANNLMNVKDRVSISAHVGPLNVIETSQEMTKTSIYRHYKSQTLMGHPAFVLGDDKQKFSCENIQELKAINELTTNHFSQSPLFDNSQAILNNHIKLSITSDHDTDVSRLFKEEGLDTYLLDYVDYYNSSSAPLYAQILDQTIFGGPGNNNVVLEYQPNQYSYDEFFASPSAMLEESKSETKNYPLSYEDALIDFDPVSAHDRAGLDFVLMGRVQRLKSKIKTFVADKKRGFMDILAGKKCFSQVVAYRVEKRDALTKEVIQNFYFFNDESVPEIEFIDTQLVYQKIYEYSIYAINFVVGNSYDYNNKNEEYTSQDFAAIPAVYDFTVDNLTKIFFIETPYFRQQIKMIDKPPVFPESEILPFFREDNRVSFRLTPRNGDMKEAPISILQSDRQAIIDMLLANPELQGSVHYSADTLPSQYQMLIMEKVPEEYSDFSTARSIIVDADYNSGFMEVNVVPNKLYYITFRSIDPAGISNPGPVYKLKINSYANGIFIDYDEYVMREIIDETPVEFQRLLSIAPSFKQSSIKFDSLEENNMNFYQSAPSSDVYSLGLDAENRLWGRKFKIRLVSKATSKAIDLNIKFREYYKTIVIDEDIENIAPSDAQGLEETNDASSAFERDRRRAAAARRERDSDSSTGSNDQSSREDQERARYEADARRNGRLTPGY
jgi:hypothetical protein